MSILTFLVTLIFRFFSAFGLLCFRSRASSLFALLNCCVIGAETGDQMEPCWGNIDSWGILDVSPENLVCLPKKHQRDVQH